ncbi:AraC family transcriptional regulator [Cellulophaga sp. F20128]|uniref:AraC family transcriptional regulator n=1 Tax=Cellulophaga sp. F20128 TaxID=2926413 RepID=UPI001FF4D549|nr:AraC family transcriptional regulator [Cellulophaga sp. F20128]MCK0158244.1 AraC family transcriptional regulator [Cellulophaga sp. F20128]
MLKKEGFKQEKSIILPKKIINELKDNEFINDLMVTDIGYYPDAVNHYRVRKNGSPQNILIYCSQGAGWVEINSKKMLLKKYDYIIISANTPHRYGADSIKPWSIYWIHFTGRKSNIFINHPNLKIEIDSSQFSRFTDRILLFEEIYNNLEMGYSKDNLEYANICLWHMLGSLRYLSQFRKIKEINAPDRVAQSIKFMQNHLNEKISLKDLAHHVNLSLSQFCNLFKEKTARTPLDYLMHLKIQKASHYLDFSDLKINEIATKLGYSDPFYFSRVFTKVMGKSPKAYRNLKKG